ncbi:MAG: alpha-amylase family glycosyl hydrolase, partial [Ruminococcus sp.]|nr:alpha-amylase family glycosyl hydrolase [Ruminococcus sp.]
MSKLKKALCLVLTLIMVMSMGMIGLTANAESNNAYPTSADDFTWDNATVYFLLTDRFYNGDESNDHSYNRGLDKDGNVADYNTVASFQGGDFKGLTEKINEGYFTDLGVNAIWVSGWYEQIHGYTVGGDGKNSFAHYAYHGYYALDYTEIDKNFGTEEEFRAMIDAAHEKGIRVVMDVVLNHPGYNTMYDMNE